MSDVLPRAVPVRAVGRAVLVSAMLATLLSFVGFAFTASPASAASPACSTAGYTIATLHDPIYYEDNSITPKVSSHYIGYRVTNNTGAAANGLWIEVPAASFTATSGTTYITLNSNDSGRDQLNNLAVGANDVSYFYVTSTYPGGGADYTVAQTHAVKIWDRRPDLAGAVELCNTTDSFTRISETIQASANKVSSSVATSNPPSIGSTMTLTVWGATGTIGAGSPLDPKLFDLSPATYSTWPVNVFRLEKVQTYLNLTDSPAYTDPPGTNKCVNTASGQAGNPIPNPGPVNNDLLKYAFGASVSTDRCYQIVYTFRVISGTTTTTALSPVQEIASGTQTKHTNIDAAYAAIPAIGVVCPTARITKTASPTTTPMTGGAVTYTVSVINNDQPGCPATSISLEDFTDTLPTTTPVPTYVSGSSTYNGSATANPTVSAGVATWVGPFVVPANTTRTLTYQLTYAQQHGTYTNSVVAHSGPGSAGVIDTTVASGDNVPATATVTVPNTPPVATNDSYQTANNTPLTVAAPGILTNDTDANGDTLTVTGVGTPSSGSVTFNANGSFTYTPVSTFSGNATFTYNISDGFGGTSSATVTVSVGPKANADTNSTARNTPVSGTVTGNDVYAPSSTFSLVSGPTAGTGTLTFNSDGTYTYNPATGFTGTSTFTYQVCLPSPNNTQCSSATVTISVAPVAVDDSFSTAHNTPVSGNLLTNDLGSSPLTMVSNTTPSTGTLSTVASNGAFTYTPANGFSGVVTFTYTMKDSTNLTSNTATARIVVGPDAIDDSASTANATPVSGNVATNDVKPAGATYAVVTGPTNGSLGASFSTTTGAFTYTPTGTFSGVDTFTYKTCLPAPDGTTCDTATVRITVAPDAIDDTNATAPATQVAGNVSTNDLKPAGATYAVVTNPGNGTLNSFNGTSGAYAYTPTAGFYGVDTFTYRTCLPAPDGLVCDTATVRISVNPDAIDDTANGTYGSPVSSSVAGNDLAPANATYTKTTNPTNGTVTVNADGTYTYTPNAGFAGVDSFTYTVCLPAPNGTLCDTATVTITIRPDAIDDTASTTNATPVTFSVAGNDLTPAGSAFTKTTDPANGSATVSGAGSATYTPNTGFAGVDSFTYTVCLPAPNGTLCDTATATVVVGPDAVNDTNTVNAGATATGSVVGNDVIAPGSTFTKASDPTHGAATVNADGTYSYTPAPGFSGTDSFTYTVCLPAPNNLTCDTATVTITVNPVAVNDSYTTTYLKTINVPANGILGNDLGTGLTVTSNTTPANGTVTVNADGSLSYTPNAFFSGTDTFTYTITDGAGHTSTAQVSILVGPNLPPVAVNDTFSANVNTPTPLDVLGNPGGTDTDPENQTLTITAVTPPASGGTATITGGGTGISYTSAPNFTGYDVFTYTISDGHGGTSTATVRVLVGTAAGLVYNDKMIIVGLGGTTVNPTTNPPATATYDRINYATNLPLATQQLVITLRDGFQPAPGDTFDIMTVSAPYKLTGAFATVYGRVLPNGVVLDVQYLNDRVRLVAMSSYLPDTTADAADANTADGVCADAAGRCTLRAAVMQANATPGAQAIPLLPKATHTLTVAGAGEDGAATGDLDVTGPTVFIGQGATIAAGGVDRAIDVRSGGSLSIVAATIRGGAANADGGALRTDGSVSLVDLTVTANTAATAGGGLSVGATGSLATVRGRIFGNTAASGAGLASAGTATLDTPTIDTNAATGVGGGVSATGSGAVRISTGSVKTNQAGSGGGVATSGSASVIIDRSTVTDSATVNGGGVLVAGGTVTLSESRITGSTAPAGAGAAVTGGTLVVLRSTIDTNTASTQGGGILNAGTVTLATSTLSGNVSPVGGAVFQTAGATTSADSTVSANRSTQAGAAAVHVAGGTATFGNSIVADQAVGLGCAAAGGALATTGYNLSSDATCGFTGTGDVVNTTAGLAALVNSGGYTPTHRPATTASAAYNTGAPTCGSVDQRGFARPVGGRCDKGSVER